MPPVEVDVLAPGDGQGDERVADLVEGGNLQVALTSMANGMAGASAILAQEFGAAAGRRTASADQLSQDSQRMWSIAMTTPTVTAAHGMRIAAESGSGRTRSETNAPHETGAGGVSK